MACRYCDSPAVGTGASEGLCDRHSFPDGRPPAEGYPGFVSVAELVHLVNACTDEDGTNGADVVEALAELIERNGGTL